MHDKIVTRLSNVEKRFPEKENDSENFVLNKLNKMNTKLDGFPEDIKKLQNELYYLKARVRELELENVGIAEQSNNDSVTTNS